MGNLGLAILVPVLRRPHRVRPLLESIEHSTPSARVLFLADPGDEPECAAIRRERRRSPLRVDAVACGGSYAAKIHEGVQRTSEPLIFTAADDLRFHPGWLEAAKERLSPPIGVVGVNDLIPRRREHATHFLMIRAYAEQSTIDGKPGPFHLDYVHWYCDDELVATAKKRGAYAYAPDAVVEHLHPFAGKAPDDKVYRLGRTRARRDRARFKQRSRLWR